MNELDPVGQVEIATEDPTTPVALDLVARASAEQAALYDLDDGSYDFNPADVQVPWSVFLVARVAGRPIGCGAIRLYERAGFARIPNYGPYVDFADSLCFEKRLWPSERT